MLCNPLGPPKSDAERQRETLTSTKSRSQCVACSEYVATANAVLLSCKDIFCKVCLKEFVLHTIKDESLFPPKCCRQLLSKPLISSVLSPEEMRTFVEAQVEYSTEKRVYCSNSNCGKFIPPARINSNQVACCRHCLTSTCCHCKKRNHSGDCPEDIELKATLALARKLGWIRCSHCSSMIELSIGCNHMTYVERVYRWILGVQIIDMTLDANVVSNSVTNAASGGRLVLADNGMSKIYSTERSKWWIEKRRASFQNRSARVVLL
jgi:hypothetical protein